jgi:hypothetical protein
MSAFGGFSGFSLSPDLPIITNETLNLDSIKLKNDESHSDYLKNNMRKLTKITVFLPNHVEL